MKIKLLLTLPLFITHHSNAQNVKAEAKPETKPNETKMEAFASKTGTIIKFVDYPLPKLRTSIGMAVETRIRKYASGGTVLYFYQIQNKSTYSSKTASIEYSDLLEIIKALAILKSDAENDLTSNPDYLENKFSTEDGFKVGYYISENKSKWYLKLDNYGSDNTIFINDVASLETAFSAAKIKIEELKSL